MDATLLIANKPPTKLAVGKNISVNVRQLVADYGSATTLETDLLNVASVIYASDLAVKREEREDYIRSITLTVPVVNCAAFNSVKQGLADALRVLSCDNWSLEFIPAEGIPEPNRRFTDAAGTTLLFSGGLDSFAGACDLLKRKHEVHLVSHITHNVPVANAQKSLVKVISKYYAQKISHVPILIFCRNHPDFPFPTDSDREETQRTRSFLFVALAAVAARMNGSRRVLVMAENGQFAVHLPLTPARVGPFSTHTAHPEFLSLIQGVFRQLLSCPDLSLDNPFVYNTKAEVVALIPDRLKSSIANSISCWMTSRVVGKTHCGECVPCMSRRLALESLNLSFNEFKRDMFRARLDGLAPDDNGKRNLTDLLEFISYFHGPHAVANDEELSFTFPELINPFVERSKAIAMYRRFAQSATAVLKRYPNVFTLLQ